MDKNALDGKALPAPCLPAAVTLASVILLTSYFLQRKRKENQSVYIDI